MTKDVLISIKGLSFEGPMNAVSDVDAQSLEVIVGGQYYDKGHARYLLYEGSQDDEEGVTKTTIKILEDRIEVTKKGAVNAVMLFATGEKNMSSYRTPWGSLMIGIDTISIRKEEMEDSLKLTIRYRLEINYDVVAELHLDIQARSKDTAAGMFA